MRVVKRTFVEIIIATVLFLCGLIFVNGNTVHIRESAGSWCGCITQEQIDSFKELAAYYQIDPYHKIDPAFRKHIFTDYYNKKTIDYIQPVSAMYYIDKAIGFISLYSALIAVLTILSVLRNKPAICLPITDMVLMPVHWIAGIKARRTERRENITNTVESSLKPTIRKLTDFLNGR